MALTKINSSVIANNTIAVGNIADNSVDATKIASNSILTRHIDDDQITTDQIAANTIATANIADNAVDGTKIASNSILTRHVDDNQIGIDQLNVSDGSSGQALTTNGSGTLSFASVGVTGISSSADATAITIDSSENTTFTGNVTVAAGKHYTTASGNDLNIVYPDTRSLFIKEAGTTHVTVDNTGKVGIGTTSPGQTLSVDASGGANFFVSRTGQTGGLYIESDGTNGVIRNPASNPILFQTNGANTRMQIGSTGKTSWSAGGIGTVATQNRDFTFYTEGSTNGVDIRSNDYQIAFIGGLGSSGAGMDKGYMQLCLDGSAKIAFNTDGASYFNGGNLGVGTDSPGAPFVVQVPASDVNAQINLQSGTYTTDHFKMYANQSGRFYIQAISNTSHGVYLSYNATSWTGVSDERLKENIVELENVLPKIANLRAVKYNFIADEKNTTAIGFIAQDWQTNFSEVVSDSIPEELGMNYTETIPVLLKAIQEQQTIIEDLKARIETLEG